jgi:hypothetical protein
MRVLRRDSEQLPRIPDPQLELALKLLNRPSQITLDAAAFFLELTAPSRRCRNRFPDGGRQFQDFDDLNLGRITVP